MKTKLIAFLVIASIVNVSCNSNSTPKCTDEQVKNMAIEIALESIVKNSNKIDLLTYLKNDKAGIEKYEKTKKQLKNLGYGDYLNNLMTYSNMFGGPDIDDELQPLIDSSLKVGNIFLNGIVINKIDKEIKKCDCGATINLGNYLQYTITYSAQYTEDNKISVTTSVE